MKSNEKRLFLINNSIKDIMIVFKRFERAAIIITEKRYYIGYISLEFVRYLRPRRKSITGSMDHRILLSRVFANDLLKR